MARLFIICFSVFLAASSSSCSYRCNGSIGVAAENQEHNNHKKEEVKGIKGMFVFGSSLVDNGNNNFVEQTRARADYLPYGIDFPLGPSGRFTNGRNVVDLLGLKLKLPCFLPAFNNPSTKGSNIIHGVNYASGGSGILDDTGSVSGNVISLSQQIRNFRDVSLPDLETQLGGCSATRSLLSSRYIFVLGSGGNDYSFNYFLGSRNLTVEAFTARLTTSFAYHLKSLYDLGARKFVIIAVNPNGCAPFVRARNPTRECLKTVNKAVHLFNTNLRSMVDTIKTDLDMPESTLVFFNSYKVLLDIIKSPTCDEGHSFRDASNPCCEVEETTGGILCRGGGSVICANRSDHVFFDGLHPTEALNAVLADKAYASNSKALVYPFNIHKLSLLC